MSDESLKIMQLNVGRFLQPRTRKFLQALATEANAPEVLCLQDIPFRDMPLLERWPHTAFAPMTNHLINGVRAVVGIVLASRYFITNAVHHTTWGDGVLKDLQGVNDKNQRFPATAETDELIDTTEDRVAICATIVKDGRPFNIATTHGYWVRGGVANDRQRSSTRELREFLVHEGERRDGLLVVGDMNFGRGGEIYKQFVGGSLVGDFRDCIPPWIDNTLDPDHPFVKKGGKTVTDWIFDLGRHDRMYVVSNVCPRPGVSDHCVLYATVEQDYAL